MIPAATRYEVTTHAISSTLAEKLPCICGSATLTIDVSRTSSVVPSITASAISHLWLEDPYSGKSVPIGVEVATAKELVRAAWLFQIRRDGFPMIPREQIRHLVFIA